MIWTLDEAKTRICPIISTPEFRENCGASKCMAWRWTGRTTKVGDSDVKEPTGYCGLAGTPQPDELHDLLHGLAKSALLQHHHEYLWKAHLDNMSRAALNDKNAIFSEEPVKSAGEQEAEAAFERIAQSVLDMTPEETQNTFKAIGGRILKTPFGDLSIIDRPAFTACPTCGELGYSVVDGCQCCERPGYQGGKP